MSQGRISNKEKEKEQARLLYIYGHKPLETISKELNVSIVSLTKWKTAGAWDAISAASKITRPEIVNLSLRQINSIFAQMEKTKDPQETGVFIDQITKLSMVIEKVEKGNNIVNFMDVFNTFDNWLDHKSKEEHSVSPEFIDTLISLQDEYTHQYNKK